MKRVTYFLNFLSHHFVPFGELLDVVEGPHESVDGLCFVLDEGFLCLYLGGNLISFVFVVGHIVIAHGVFHLALFILVADDDARVFQNIDNIIFSSFDVIHFFLPMGFLQHLHQLFVPDTFRLLDDVEDFLT